VKEENGTPEAFRFAVAGTIPLGFTDCFAQKSGMGNEKFPGWVDFASRPSQAQGVRASLTMIEGNSIPQN
jgi:hypothetical protein